MLALRELRQYKGAERVWVGKYKDLVNLPHWHYDSELVYVEAGAATVSIDKDSFRLDARQAVFIAPEEAHHIIADKDSILAFMLFDRTLIDSLLCELRLASPLLGGDYGIPRVFDAIDAELAAGGPLYCLSINNRLERLMLDIFAGEETRPAADGGSLHAAGYKELLKEIDAHYDEYSLADAASFLGFSESYFSAYFKRMTGMTFSRYLNLVRVEKAIERMRREKTTMTKIAIECGFGTIRNFNRVFNLVTGYSPKNLPANYDMPGAHPTYGVEDVFDPTDESSVLIEKPSSPEK